MQRKYQNGSNAALCDKRNITEKLYFADKTSELGRSYKNADQQTAIQFPVGSPGVSPWRVRRVICSMPATNGVRVVPQASVAHRSHTRTSVDCVARLE